MWTVEVGSEFCVRRSEYKIVEEIQTYGGYIAEYL